MKRYSVLTYIFNDYDLLREVEELDEEAEYICVTDDKNLTSNTWNVIYDAGLVDLSPFDKCYSVRFNCFKYCTTDICLRIDGSVQINKSLKPLIDDFEEGGFDTALMIHPFRNNMVDEYNVWINARNYPLEQTRKCINFMSGLGYDFSYRGLFQLCISIQRKNKTTSAIDKLTMCFMKSLGSNGVIERLDQTIFTFVINQYFSHLKILPIGQDIFDGSLMTWYKHNTEEKITFLKQYAIKPYMFNKPVALFHYD